MGPFTPPLSSAGTVVTCHGGHLWCLLSVLSSTFMDTLIQLDGSEAREGAFNELPGIHFEREGVLSRRV